MASPLEYWLYPGAAMTVSTLTKVQLTAAAPGEVPPQGAMVIPPQSSTAAAAQTVLAAQQANVDIAKKAMLETQALTQQAAEAVQKVETETLTKAVQPPPWSVTFTEQK